MVYLSETYAPYFAFSATPARLKWGIIEVDTDLLDESLLYPDEDFLEQTSRGQSGLQIPDNLGITQRTQGFRRHIEIYQHHWKDSIDRLGNCSYKGTIPPEAITRVVTYDPSSNSTMTLAAIDPAISLMNHSFCADKYRNLTRWFMKEEITPEEYYGAVLGPFMNITMSDRGKENLNVMLKKQSGIKMLKGKACDHCIS